MISMFLFRFLMHYTQ